MHIQDLTKTGKFGRRKKRHKKLGMKNMKLKETHKNNDHKQNYCTLNIFIQVT